MSQLADEQAQPGAKALDSAEASQLLGQLDGWSIDGKTLTRQFDFEDFYETAEFIGALAWIANRQNHHPDITAGYNKATVTFTTHDAGGLTRSDFICAAKVDRLFTL